MPAALDQIAKEAMDLTPHQKLALAGLLLVSAEAEETHPEADAAWETEIRERIRAIDDGKVAGVGYDEVMRAAETQLSE